MADKEAKSTMRKFATNYQANYYSGITSITVNGNNAYELQGKFLDDLHNNAFSGANGEDTIEHIEYFLNIVDPIDLHNVNQDKLRVVVFPILLVGDAWKWFDEIKGSITCWVDLTEKFLRKYYPPSRVCDNVKTKVKKDLTDITFEECMASKLANHMTMDPLTKKVLRDSSSKNDHCDEVINDGSSNLEETNNDDEQEINEIFILKQTCSIMKHRYAKNSKSSITYSR
nr:hypothetical protein [Tanacetum cinerariifolium]GFB05136.1 hypothetical protein [Tanacetum cinerariifolium]GFB05739.1 hypothetical protein [Tanacetum cinerariifolium]